MADDKAKKTKIDLKARLGQKTQTGMQPPGPLQGMPGAVPPDPSSDPGAPPLSNPSAPASAPSSVPSVRPPSGMGAPPMGIAPPPGLSPGIPIPPFAQAQRQAPAPAAPKPTAAQQTIKVEMGEEMDIERKKWRQRVMLGGFAGVIIGLVIGFVGGGSKEKGDRAGRAARGAGLLEKEVKGTIDKLKEMETKLGEASDKLKAKSYPDDLATALAGLTIPFESATLDGKDVGSLSPRVLKSVINFTSAVEGLNKSRESLRNILGIAKEPITKSWKEEAAPVAHFSVVFRTEPGGKTVVGELVPNKDPFAWKGAEYPGSYKVTRIEGGKPAEKSATRWVKGELPGNDLTAIPLDPKSVAGFTSEQLVNKLALAVRDLKTELQGNKDNPTNETPGLVKMAEDLTNELHKASTANQ